MANIAPRPLCYRLFKRSIGNVPLGEECNIRISQTNYPPQITTPLTYNAWNEQDTVVIGTTAGGDELWLTLIYQYHQSRLEVMCWLLNNTYDGNLQASKYVPVLMTANARPEHADPTINRANQSTRAGDIHEWAPAFDVGSSGKNVVSVTNFLLIKMKASHPHALDDEDTDDSPFVLIYPDVIVID
ncbi:hypothetical protein K504DRAFT_466299 [Pleomassaria siparia CBS 279.74]|uniref:Uncharacterized protein n=1 Tax=Pleomassaria siparia CBS 279.74 TaxID=1314801 RepID=A0A6G1JPE9_9PLEO|nr:hypothetical protein K504DRAFT_466299 [Pleomassaria siparia CBS 279.74]